MCTNTKIGTKISIPEALNQGLIVGQLRSAVRKEVMQSAYKTKPEVSVFRNRLRCGI